MVHSSDSLSVSRSSAATKPFVPFEATQTEQSLSRRFEQQVSSHPDRIAVKFKGHSVSYRQLSERANRIAWALLHARGEGQEQIALLLENGDMLIAAILGVLKAGKVYVPLDPSIPQTRTQFILQDSLATVILTNDKNLSLAARLAGGEVQIIKIDDLDSNVSIENLGLAISPDALAYIIYTSGSTGKPKGVMETHRNLLHNVMRNTNALQVSVDDRISLLRSIGAGGAARDALTALLNGAELCPFSVNDDGLGNLSRWLIDEEITIFTSVISVFRHFVAGLSGAERFEKLRLIYAGGEQVTKADVELYQRYFSDDCLFVNRLGITETGTVAYFFINKQATLSTGVVPVGYAAEDTEILLFDETGHEVGPDCVGEIAVKSRYISPGYWRSPELTQSMFLPDPDGGNKRIYLTGDLGLKRPDGCLSHMGRKDFQVNIRGYRVEVSEVEAELRNHPAVNEVAVVGREHPSGEIRLAAAIIARADAGLTRGELRDFLKDRLPDYMIPSAFMFLDEMPVGANGKIDRSVIPSPDWKPSRRSSNRVGARDELEQLIVGIWEEVLGLEAVDVDENFFHLGGHSLLLGQIVSKLQTVCKAQLPLADFFEQPTVATLADMIQKAVRSAEDVIIPVPKALRDESLPLSFAQERLWFLHQLEPDTGAYNIPTATLIEGRLDYEAMERALNEVIKRHESLRTSFAATNGQPVQVILPELHLSLPVLDLSDRGASDSDAAIQRIIMEQSQQPFDLAKAPLLRVFLLKLGANRHVFVTIHHLIGDAWSVGVLFHELSVFYNIVTGEKSSLLLELPIQYVDFVIWQRQYMLGDRLASHVSYWRRQLGQNLPRSELPSDRIRPIHQSFRGARQSIAMQEDLTAGVKALSRLHSVTPFMTLLAAFKSLLFRYTGSEEIIVGSPIGGRSRAEVENLIGLFVNTLVLRTDLSGDPTFRELLGRQRDVCLDAYARQDLPFEKLVEELQPERDMSRNPLFQVMFIFQNPPVSTPNFTGTQCKRLDVDSGTAKFDLTVTIFEQNGKFVGNFEYSTDLFDRETIARMVRQYQILLESVIADPNQRISTLPILTDAERHQLLVEWNDTTAEYPQNTCIHELFEDQAQRTPDSVAVAIADTELTYRQLNSRANQLAHYLRRLGVGPDSLVGICVERSLEMVVGLLGILKAGGAYVPLDPAYPKERLRFMLEDAEVSVVVTQEKFLESGQRSVVDGQPLQVCLDRDWPVIQRQRSENPKADVASKYLAYVIYTSGSTGEPKGVQIEHRSVVNCLRSIGQRIGFVNEDVLLAVTTIAFDIAGLELYLPLLAGGTVVLASREQAADGAELWRRLKECSATVMQGTPSTWRMLIEAGWEGSPEFKILCGGESLSRELAEALLTRGEVWNLYGPTETTIWSTIQKVESGEGPVPIGRPIANTRTYILDAHLRPVPIGVHGDLYIGGDGLARGYWNEPELTAEKFIANRFAPGERLYKTGDRARYLPDSNIEYIGRTDNQVKLRGYRIELGEIESVLNQHPAVRESAIVVRDREPSGEKDLVGYFVRRQESTLSIAELRGFLREKLPGYMTPSVFVKLEVLPLTLNGKIDRNALPSPDGARPQLDDGFPEPRTEIEELVAQVWKQVLKLDKIGVNDNFFELGGHSLLATRVVARLRNNFAIDLPLRKLFELPTVAALAQHIDGLLQNQGGTTTPPIVPAPRDRLIPASFSQQRLCFLHELDPDSTAYNISSVFSIRGSLDVSTLEEAVNALIARHEILRTTFSVVNGTPAQNILPALTLSLLMIDLGRLPEEAKETEARKIALEEARRPFDLRNGPLIRARLLSLGGQNYLLLLNFDHTILDGWSMGTLFKELGSLYDAFASRQPSSLPPLPVQYADFALWQRERLQGDVLESQLEYWKRQLGNDLVWLNLPTDYPRPAIQSSRGIRKIYGLSKPLTDSIKELSRREGVTVFMTLLAALKVLLNRYTGQEDVTVGSTVAGRTRPEMEGLIGFFINALPLRSDLSGNPSFLELLKRVREVCLRAYTHQDVPFEKIVEAVKPSRDLSRHPLFQVMFNMADVSERVLQLAGCEVRKESFFDPEAKFDITLYAPEKDGTFELAIVYNADLFSESRSAIMLEQFGYLLSQIAEKPQATIGEYSLAVPSTPVFLPDPTESLDDRWEGCIHAYVAQWAERAPDRLALVDSNETWTYGELETCSNQIAHYLIAQGIRPKDVVAIYAHRNSNLVLALLGVLMAGAVFAILDPAYPTPRLIDYVRLARPKGWIQMDAAGGLPKELVTCLETLNVSCRLNLPRAKQAVADLPREQPESQRHVVLGANDPAYIAFTSGSTGEPKGVLSRHGPITHFLPWQTKAFKLCENDRFALLSGLAYNHLHRDIFTALHLGATLYIPESETARSPEGLAEWLQRNEISVLHLTPALGQLLMTAGEKTLPFVRRIFFGGDVLTRQEVAKIRELAPNAKIGSFYGATETQRAVGYYEIPEDMPVESGDGTRAIPLGRGIKDVQLLVLNPTGRLAGVGELGELCMRSPHLAEGYIGDEKLSNETFVTNPFTNDPNDRLYRTGELARYLPDANVEWAGRNDRRVNIRGFRVELGEIESVLKQHPTVKNAAVVLQDYEIPAPENLKPETRNPKLAKRLVAYVVTSEEASDSFTDLLHGYLSTRLPDYMVPAHYVILDRLPLSPNGKVDYNALSSSVQFLSSTGESSGEPQTAAEHELVKIFARVLGCEKVGIDENFFRLGGHSLLAAQAAARIRKVFGISLELRTFLESPTVNALAKELDRRLRAGHATPIRDDTDREEIEL